MEPRVKVRPSVRLEPRVRLELRPRLGLRARQELGPSLDSARLEVRGRMVWSLEQG